MNIANRILQRHEPDPFKGLIAGLAGGFVGTLAMTAAQSVMMKMTQSNDSSGDADDRERSNGQQEKPANVKAADAVSENVFHHHLSEREEKYAGEAVHFGFGTTMGGLYGVVCEYIPNEALGIGAPFGTAVMLGADEIVVPALKLTDPPWKQPASTHGYAFVSHLVYGVTTELVRRSVRSML